MESLDLSQISQITQDSRLVKPGGLFAAIKGEKGDGAAYIPQALANGADVIICAEQDHVPETQARIIRVAEPRLALAQIAARYYPAQPEHMVAVTGTDGKTSTADFFRQLVHLCGGNSASIGTIGVWRGDGKKIKDESLTTPGAVAMHQMLSELAAGGITHACIEASSHGLDQYRIHGVRLQAASFTNIARDHLDYHETEDAYFNAKAKLFTEVLPPTGIAIINADDNHASRVVDICKARGHTIVDFGFAAEAMKIISLNATAHGQELTCRINGSEHKINIPLVGSFQTMNILAALGLAAATGLDMKQLLDAIPKLQGVPGRLQLAATRSNGAAIYVDYAHTPAALSNVLKTLRPHTKNKLHVVFGCGGNRDAGKRVEMGKIANDLADVVIVTDDNPRNETPAIIRHAIMVAATKATEIADRSKAIYAAVHALDVGDVLVIAGKGHEKIQIIGSVEHRHDDVEVAKEAAGIL